MSDPSSFEARLQARLGYRFADPQLLDQALTHRSVSAHNNERLEFLGDGALNFVIGAALYASQPKVEEGALSRLRASLVREETLARLARELALGDCMRLGESELKSGGYRRDSILADALEAVLGAIYLDGGFAEVQRVVLGLYEEDLRQLPDPEKLKDAKTRLQEWLQARARPLPSYEILSESGPAHARRFQVRCQLADAGDASEAEGSSRRAAEQCAAERLLGRLEGTEHLNA
ncbi:MAG: ribonuclease III [Nevskiales bacterium]|nr:ribonuclease III [Nevskiales bacterium]